MIETLVAARSKLKQKIARFIARLKNQRAAMSISNYFCESFSNFTNSSFQSDAIV